MLLKKPFLVFKNKVKCIQTAGYDGTIWYFDFNVYIETVILIGLYDGKRNAVPTIFI